MPPRRRNTPPAQELPNLKAIGSLSFPTGFQRRDFRAPGNVRLRREREQGLGVLARRRLVVGDACGLDCASERTVAVRFLGQRDVERRIASADAARRSAYSSCSRAGASGPGVTAFFSSGPPDQQRSASSPRSSVRPLSAVHAETLSRWIATCSTQ
jgi:hypothetical protein